MKVCRICGIQKVETEFYFANKPKGQIRTECKKCTNSITSEWAKSNPDRIKELSKASRKKNSVKQSEYRKAYKEKNWQYWKDWRIANLEKSRAYARKSQTKRRELSKMAVYSHYGMKCACCGESQMMFLTIDHINNDGAEHRKKLKGIGGSPFFEWLVRNNFPEGFQTLCRNCNWGKHVNHGICPHQSS